MASPKFNIVDAARSKRHVALLEKLNSRTGLSPREIEELGDFERKAAQRAAAGKVPNAQSPKPNAPRRRRLSAKYRDLCEPLAGIFVACGENCNRAAIRVRELIPGLDKFQPNMFGRWKNNAEWKAAVAAAKDDAKFERELKAARRGRQFLKWAADRMEKLTADLTQAIAEQDSKAVAALEGRVLKLNESMRGEEKYQLENERLASGKAALGMHMTISFGGREDGAAAEPNEKSKMKNAKTE